MWPPTMLIADGCLKEGLKMVSSSKHTHLTVVLKMTRVACCTIPIQAFLMEQTGSAREVEGCRCHSELELGDNEIA